LGLGPRATRNTKNWRKGGLRLICREKLNDEARSASLKSVKGKSQTIVKREAE